MSRLKFAKSLFWFSFLVYNLTVPYADALVYSAKCLKYKQSGILNKIVQTCYKEEVIQQNLQWNHNIAML